VVKPPAEELDPPTRAPYDPFLQED